MNARSRGASRWRVTHGTVVPRTEITVWIAPKKAAWLSGQQLAARAVRNSTAAAVTCALRTIPLWPPRRRLRVLRVVPATGQRLHAQRLQHAQRLLERTDLPVDAVAERVGLGNTTNLHKHFRRLLDTSPHAYRRAVRPPEPAH
jgi:AraC-like DNA-binding protein